MKAPENTWDFCCRWYGVDEIHASISRSFRTGTLAAALDVTSQHAPPLDVQSREFAVWLANQYRLAMNKGIQLGREWSAVRGIEPKGVQ